MKKGNLRGRSHSRRRSRADNEAIESLARIAVGNKIDSSEFFDALVNAWNQKESMCKNLVIRCRKKTHGSAIFLFTIDRKVVAQFAVPEHILEGSNPLEGYTNLISAEASSVKNSKAINPRIKDLEAGMKQVNLEARVLEIPEPRMVYTKFGTQAYVSNALIADKTGTIRLSLWNQQITQISVGDVIKIERGKVARFRGKRQLRIGRSGDLSVIEETGFPP